MTLDTTHIHYELEFDNCKSSHARRLYAVAEAEATLTGNGNGNRGRHIQTTSHTTSLSTVPPIYSTRLNSSPENKTSVDSLLIRVPEDGDPMDFHSHSLTRQGDDHEDVEHDRLRRSPSAPPDHMPRYFGGHSLANGGDDEDDEEEEEWLLDEELARQGLYRGSYRQLISLYSLTPAFTLLVFLALAYFPSIAYPLTPDETSERNPTPYLPYPLPEFLTATAFWSLTYLLNSGIFSLFSSLFSPSSFLTLGLNSLVQSAIGIILRQATIPILLVPLSSTHDHPTWHDIIFRRVWWVALGWAAAEAIVGIKQGYEGIALYQDVLVSVNRIISTPNRTPKSTSSSAPLSSYGSIGRGGDSSTSRPGTSPRRLESTGSTSNNNRTEDAERQPLMVERRLSAGSSITARNDARLKDVIEEEVDRDVDELIAIRGREELEDLFGMPFIYIPVFISCLHRLNSVLFVLGSTLLLTAAYMRSSISLKPNNIILISSSPPLPPSSSTSTLTLTQNNTHLLITFPIILFLSSFLLILHSPKVLPRIGVQSFVYVGFMISLGVFFAGLGVWEGIV